MIVFIYFFVHTKLADYGGPSTALDSSFGGVRGQGAFGILSWVRSGSRNSLIHGGIRHDFDVMHQPCPPVRIWHIHTVQVDQIDIHTGQNELEESNLKFDHALVADLVGACRGAAGTPMEMAHLVFPRYALLRCNSSYIYTNILETFDILT